MLYIAIPAHNEGQTIGVLLWRIRKVFQGYSREYEILVYDDASTDGTTETLAPYSDVAPLTVIRGETRKGYGHALSVLAREVSRRTKYPRRDAMIVMQGDFTDQPEHLPELVKRFEGGADVVAAERVVNGTAPEPVRKHAQLTRWARRLWPMRSFATVPGMNDPFGGYRLLRISIVRDLLKEHGDGAFANAPVWATNVELLRTAVRLARSSEAVPLEARWDLRPRESRVKPWPDVIDLAKRAWAARSGRSPRAVA